MLRYCLGKVQNRYIWLPLFVQPPTEGFPWDDLRKNFYRKVTDGQVAEWRRNISENFNRLSRAHERYRRQTVGRTIAVRSLIKPPAGFLKATTWLLSEECCFSASLCTRKRNQQRCQN